MKNLTKSSSNTSPSCLSQVERGVWTSWSGKVKLSPLMQPRSKRESGGEKINQSSEAPYLEANPGRHWSELRDLGEAEGLLVFYQGSAALFQSSGFFLISAKREGLFLFENSTQTLSPVGFSSTCLGFVCITHKCSHTSSKCTGGREEKRDGGKVDPRCELYPGETQTRDCVYNSQSSTWWVCPPWKQQDLSPHVDPKNLEAHSGSQWTICL